MINYIRIPEELARKLHAIAEREDDELAATVGEMIEAQSDDRPWATLADLGEFARQAREQMNGRADAEIESDAAWNRESLGAEYAEYLASRVEP